MNPEEIHRILEALRVRGWSADNIAFGMGGALLQKLNRDTQQFAFKAAHISGSYGERDVFKSPVTDQAKRSKRGKLRLVRNEDGTLETVPANQWIEKPDVLRPVFKDGEILVDDTFAEIRERAAVTSF